MVTLFFLKLAAGIILGVVSGFLMGLASGNILGILLNIAVAVGWWIGIIFLMNRGFKSCIELIFDGFFKIMQGTLGAKDAISGVIIILGGVLQMILAFFTCAIEGWKELIREVQKISATNADLKHKGYVLCKNEEEFRIALSNQNKLICIESPKGIDKLLRSVYDTEPWLNESCGYTSTKTITDGTVGKKELFEISYHPLLARKKEDVIEDDGKWTLFTWGYSSAVKEHSIHIVTKDLEDLKERIFRIGYALSAFCPGVTTLSVFDTPETKDGFCSVFIDLNSVIDKKTIKQGTEKAKEIIRQTDKKEFGGGTDQIPKLMKVFMTYAYFQLKYNYDDSADETFWHNFESNEKSSSQLALFSAAFFVIMNHSGTSVGFASAFKMFMDHHGISCEYIVGKKDDRPHVWNQIKINDGWYHLDVSCGFESKDRDDVSIQGFMRTDKQMKKIGYTWDPRFHHSCLFEKFSYKKVTEYVDENGALYESLGANEAYFAP